MTKFFLSFAILLLSTTLINAQTEKKVLTFDDFASWNIIRSRQISPNGEFIAYELNRQKGDGRLIVYSVKNNTNDTIQYGYSAKFSPASDFIAFKIKPAADTVRKAKLAKVKKNKMPKDSIGILNLKTKKLTKFPQVQSFKIPDKNGNWIAILTKHQKTENDTVSKKKKPEKSNDLIIFNPSTGNKNIFNRIKEYTIAQEGNTVAMVSKVTDTTKNYAVILFNTKTLITDTLLNDSITIKKITLSKSGSKLAYLASADTVDSKVFSLYYTTLNKPALTVIADTNTTAIPKGWSPSVNRKPFFSDDETKLFFGTAKKPVTEPEDSLLDEEKPKLDVWSWTDIELQPMQLLNVKKEKKRTYTAVYLIKNKKINQLGDTIVKNISLTNKNNGDFALGFTDTPYKRATSWNALWINDYYLINVKTGDKKLILKGKIAAYLSPQGKYTVWYEINDSSYYALNNKSGKKVSLTKNIPVMFCNEENDIPTYPEPYGIEGWAKNDNFIFINDRYDIWKIDLSGKEKPVNITNTYGRKNKISFNYIKLNKELVYIPEDKPVLLRGVDQNNYSSGYYKTIFDKPQNPVNLIKGDFMLRHISKAENTDVIIWTAQTVKDYPDIKISKLDFKNAKTISQANPQQKQYNWATVEFVQWKSFTGDTLKGLLYKPENFNSNKKYPVMAYFYEKSSQNIHYHYTPYPSHSTINKIFYASNEYLVFVPDITYKTGYPGQSAYNAIVSGADYLINTFNFVDADKIALQGQSWGGYQTAYLITQIDMFAAAMAGAPVSNMTSAYGGIRWGSGMSRMFQYEHTQSRIGGTLWDKTMQYIENSPVFYAPKVNTPLLIMHNDHDGAVPWYQGIEYFVALRRLNKPVWMLNYNGMQHNIEHKYWANRMDLSKRMFGFFNHYLKNEPAPEWMIKGIPAIEKGKTLGY
jgi:dipeptidyl aminopeptidase/acylaminoacyl peptidase